MIDLNEYNLVYYRKDDIERKNGYPAKRNTGSTYLLWDEENKKKIPLSVHMLRKEYVTDELATKRARAKLKVKIA